MSVIIVGGGMAGATLALALSHLTEGRLAIDLVEAKRPDDGAHPGFDDRSIALALGTCQKLDNIGVWPKLSDNAAAITFIDVADRGWFGRVSIAAKEYRLPALGYVVELRDTGEKLFSLLARQSNVRLHCPARMVAVKRTPDSVEITLDSGKVLSGRLAVAADGADSPLASALGIARRETDYQQSAIIANLVFSAAKPGQAYEYFTRGGPLALLPMTNGRCSLVWCSDGAEAETLATCSDRDFIERLQREIGWRLGKIERLGERRRYPLILRRAENLISHRLALVGNAAQTLHPIAGQGFNLGIRDVFCLAETVSKALTHNQDLGAYNVLSCYQKDRLTDQNAIIAATDGLVRLFNARDPVLSVARNLAMIAMDNGFFLQRRLVERMLGQFKR